MNKPNQDPTQQGAQPHDPQAKQTQPRGYDGQSNARQGRPNGTAGGNEPDAADGEDDEILPGSEAGKVRQ